MPKLDYFAIHALLNSLAGLLCAALVFFQNPRNRKNLFFAIHCFAMGSVYYLSFRWWLSKDPAEGLFYFRAVMMPTIWMPVTHLHYTLMMFDMLTPFRKKILYTTYVGTTLLTLANFTPLFLKDVRPILQFKYWAIPGPLFPFFLIFSVFSLNYCLYLLWKYRSESPPLLKNKMSWLLLATVFGYGGAGTNWPLYFNLPIPPIFNINLFFYMLISSFMFFQLGLLDINLFFKDTTIHLITALLIGGACSLFALPFVKDMSTIFWIVAVAMIVPFAYRPIFIAVQEILNKTKLGQSGQYLKTVDVTMARIKESTYTYDDLARNIVKSITKTFPTAMAAVYFFDVQRKEFQLRAQTGMKNPMVSDLHYNRSMLAISESDSLLQHIGGNKDLVLKDAFQTKVDISRQERAVLDSLDKIEGEVVAPFLIAGKIKGMLVLGVKKTGNIYNREDREAIFAFARMGEEVMRYIMGMEAELNHTSLYSHDMNNDTKSLVQTLQFLQSSLAIKQPKEKLDNLLHQAEDVAVRLNQTFELNRDRSSLIMKSLRGDYDRSPIDIVKCVRASCGKYTLMAEKKKISLKTNIPNESVTVEGNAGDLIRVLDNLINNAMRYVDAGGTIEVGCRNLSGAFEITVKDSGKGIDPADIERIWTLGWQAKDARQGASGFGLSIARQIVHLHHGRIHVESEGQDKGTLFRILIPLLDQHLAENGSEVKQEAKE